ncbi:HPr family phosphocarrier protein, partial [Mesorhizobium sp. M00.F.Ca.ET.186.01.1.1]
QGDKLLVSVDGADEETVAASIQQLFEQSFQS